MGGFGNFFNGFGQDSGSCGFGGCESIIWLLLILCCCGKDGMGNLCGILPWILILCCCCKPDYKPCC